jgi:hypothetical protein
MQAMAITLKNPSTSVIEIDLTTVRMPSDGTRVVSSEKSHETNSDVGFDGRLPRLVASCFRSSPHAAVVILSGSNASILVPSIGRD